MLLQRGNEELSVPEGVPWAHLKALGWEPAEPAGPQPDTDDVEDDPDVKDPPPAPKRRSNRK